MNTGLTSALAAALPNATNVYVGLVTQLPTDAAGTGLIEAAGSGYARVAASAWTTVNNSLSTVRSNSSAVVFAALSAALSNVVGWGIWSASTGGSLIACGTVNGGVPMSFIATDVPTIAIGSLALTLAVGA